MGKKLLSVFFLVSIFFLSSISGFGQECPSTPGTISNNDTGPVCPGDVITYLISSVPNADANGYSWTVPTGWNIISGHGSNSISVTAGSAGQNGNIEVTASNSCGTSAKSSTSVTLVAGIPDQPGNITGNTVLCPNEILTYSISSVTDAESYNWSVPTGWQITSGATTNSITVDAGNRNQNGQITVTAQNSCGTGDTRSLDVIVIDPSVSITAQGPTAICSFENVGFYVSNFNDGGAGSYTYEWQKFSEGFWANISTGTTISSGASGTSVTLDGGSDIKNGNKIRLQVNFCEDFSITSNEFTVTVNNERIPEVEVSASVSEICAGEQVTFTASPINGGTNPQYVWYIGNAVQPGASGAQFSTTLEETSTIKVEFTSNTSCVDSSKPKPTDEIEITVNPLLTPEVEIEASTTEICKGESITFNVNNNSLVNQGNPSYRWLINGGQVVQSGGSSFSTNTLEHGDEVYVEMTSDIECVDPGTNPVLSNKIEVIVNPVVNPTVSISSNDSDGIICTGAPVTFEIDQQDNAGGSPSYNWYLNGGNPVGTGLTFQSSELKNGDQIYVIMIPGDDICYEEPATSEPITMTVNPYLNPIVDIESDKSLICSGGTVNFTSTVTEGGSNPQYQWYVNDILKATTASYSPSDLPIGENVSVYLKVTIQDECVTSEKKTITSEAISIEVVEDAPSVPVFTPENLNNNTNIKALCPIAQGFIYEVQNDDEVSEYVWTVPAGWSIKSGQGSHKITVDIGNGTANGTNTIKVKAKNICGEIEIQYQVSVDTYVSVNAGDDVLLCDTATSIGLVGTYTFAGSGGTGNLKPYWTTSGDGTFANTSQQNQALNNTYTFGPGDKSNGSVILYLHTEAKGGCQKPGIDELIVTFYEDAIVESISNSFAVCQGENINLSGSIGGSADTSTWTANPSTAGTFADANQLNPIFTTDPSFTGDITFTLTASGPCSPDGTDTVVVTVEEASTVNAGEDFSMCSTDSFTLNGSFIGANGSGVQWSTDGDGAFGEGTSETSTYTPGTSDIANGTVTLTLTTTGSPDNCAEVFDEVIVNVFEQPTVSISPDANDICEDDTYEITATVTGDYNNGSWSTSGDGTFGSATNLSSVYTPGTTDISIGSVDLTYTVQADNEDCGEASSSVALTIEPLPVITGDEDWNNILCSNSKIILDGLTISGPISKGKWEIISGGGSLSNISMTSDYNSVEYTPVPNKNSEIVLRLTTEDPAGNCSSVSYDLNISARIEPRITSQPSNVGVCSTQPSELTVVATGDNLRYEWYKNDEMVGPNSSTFSFSNTTSSDIGEYYVKIYSDGECEPAISEKVTINVDEDIIIEAPVRDVPVCSDGFSSATFEFVAHANGAELSFSWLKDGENLDTANDSHLAFDDLERDADGVYTGSLTISGISNDEIDQYTGDYQVLIEGPEGFSCSTAISNVFFLRVNEFPDPPVIAQEIEVCQGEDVDLKSYVTGENLHWYADETGGDYFVDTSDTPIVPPSFTTDVAQIYEYWVTQSPDVCESAREKITIIVKPTPATPTPSTTAEFCFGADATALNPGALGDAPVLWYSNENAETPIEVGDEGLIPDTQTAGTTSYWVSQILDGCESARAKIEVIINDLPTVSITVPEGTPRTDEEIPVICRGSEITLTGVGASTYVWQDDTGTTYEGTTINVSPEVTTTYTVKGTNGKTCEGTAEIVIAVDPPTVAGTLTGPESVCVTSPNGTIALSGFTGEIQRWEKSTDGSSWTSITETSPSLTFSNLTVSTSYRAVVKNGVCGELPSNEIEVKIDPLPVGGKLAFESIITTDNDGRVFIICEVNDAGYADPLSLINSEGQVVAWRYRGASDTSWSEIRDGDGNNFTGNILSAAQIESIINTNINSEGKIETTVFRVEIRSGACTSNVFSETAIISVIPSTIKPTPVTVNPEIVCIGESINLYAETGYENGTDIASGGMFDNSSITNHGWRVRKEGNTQDLGFSSSANTTQPDFWLRTNPKSFLTATRGTIPFSSDGSNNNPFVIISGNHPATLEIPVFKLDGTDEAILTFDQAYDLLAGSSIRIEISTNGGSSYNTDQPLFEVFGPTSSGNYGNFGAGSEGINRMQIDLGQYIGQNNLRIRFRYLGKGTGDVWAFDNVDVPDGPRNVTIEWRDSTIDPDNPILISRTGTATWTPTQIGLNTYVVQTLLTTNSNGEQCDVIQHEETVEVFVYDTYNSSPAAGPIACGTNSFELSTAVTGGNQGLITEYPTADGYIGYWEVVESPDGYVYDVSQWSGGITNPSAIFTPNIVGSYSLRWALELEDETAISECENEINEIELNIYDQYTSTATAAVEACGDNSIELTGILQGVLQGTISTLPTPDGTYGEWQVINGPEGYEYDENQFSSSNTSISPINDPSAIFTPTLVGTYTLRWAIINENNTDCEHSVTDVDVTVYDLYTSTAEAVLDTCATNSFNLTATVTGAIQGVISLPALDGTTGKWEVIEFPEGYEFSESHFTGGSTNPNTVFTPVILGEYTLNWTLVNENQAAECIIPATVSVKLFDQYTLTAEAKIGSCGDFVVQLTGTTSGIWQENLTYPTQDGYIGQWRVEGGDGTFSNPDINDDLEPINNPNAIYTATDLSNYTFYWELVPDPNYEGDFIENTSCPATPAEISIEVKECIALDFDGVNDYADLGNGYTGNYSYEAWIRPYDREIPEGGTTNSLVGTIISGPGYEINMEDLPNTIVKNSRWYHIAVTSSGKLFVDGIPISSYSLTTGGQAATIIGASINPETGISENHFSGWIEEVRIWTGEIEQDQIRFLMNQRLQNAANIGVEIPMVAPGLPYTSLAGYYQLLAVPELIAGGITPNLAQNQQNNPGLLLNMETLQENTAPLPYTSRIDGQTWATDDTWTNYTVWDAPNSAGIDGTPIDWNIVKTDHNIHSGDKDITVLGLKSMTAEKLLTVFAPGTENEYNEGRKLRVTHYLLLNGNIDLIGQSQLLQDSGSILDESSGGWLERDQQGKENSLVYNYWSSPVSPQGQANNAAYTIKSVLNNPNGTITYVNDPFAADATPVNANNVIISSYWLNAYYANTADQYALWKRILETGTLKTGEGFTMKGTSGSAALEEERNYTFKGKPHNGDFGLSIAADQNYLIGNPYPSALDGWKFIENNIDRNVFDGSLYFWDHFKEVSHILKEYVGGYAVLNLTSEIGVPAISIDERINPTEEISQKKPTRFIPVSQGFMINSTGVNGGEVQFKNSQREFVRDGDQSTSLFLKPEVITKSSKNESDDYSRIRLSFSSPIGYYRQILVGAIPHTTNGFDFGYDAFLFDDNVEDMYWIQDNNNLVIQGVPNFNNDQVLPLGIKVKENKEFLIKIDELENTPESFNIYLKDNLNDTIHNLRAAPYTSTSEPGIIQDRFEIVFFNDEIIVEKPLPEIPEEEIPGDKWDDFTELTVRHSHTKREIQILNPNQFPLSNMYIFDINGNQIEHYRNLSHEKEVVVPVRNFSSGVYIVQLYSEGRIISKKIIINN